MAGKSKLSIVTNGLLKENPSMVLVLGTCPTLATTSTVANGFGMGISAMAVLICSNIVISMLRKVIPDKVRIPCYITVIAGFVTIVQFILQAYMPALYSSLGLFIPLIVVNCIILGRAEMFANKNTIFDSALDGLGMGLGFTMALVLMGTIREICSQGTWLGYRIIPASVDGMGIFSLAPGGFFVFAIIMAGIHYITRDKSKIRKEFGLGGVEDMKLAEEELKRQQEEEKARKAAKEAA
ncbi:MAG: electron transport complex subunit E [Eubacteriales bacterium]|nr:electron transport complex subunit E [Eubacteriales bacterium]